MEVAFIALGNDRAKFWKFLWFFIYPVLAWHCRELPNFSLLFFSCSSCLPYRAVKLAHQSHFNSLRASPLCVYSFCSLMGSPALCSAWDVHHLADTSLPHSRIPSPCHDYDDVFVFFFTGYLKKSLQAQRKYPYL